MFCGGREPQSSEAPGASTAQRDHRVWSQILFASGKAEHASKQPVKLSFWPPQINCKWVFAERSQALPLLHSENCPCRNVDYRTTFKHLPPAPHPSPPAASTQTCVYVGVVFCQSALVFHFLCTPIPQVKLWGQMRIVKGVKNFKPPHCCIGEGSAFLRGIVGRTRLSFSRFKQI